MMRTFRILIATAAAAAVAFAIPVSPAQAQPSIQIDYSTSCGRVTVVSSSSEKIAVYYGPASLSTDLSEADGTLALGPSLLDFEAIATTRSTLYVTSFVFGSAPSSWTVKALTVPQDCKGVQSGLAITGTRRVGHTLTAKLVNWVPQPLFWSYTWYRSGKEISGATDATYTLTAADRHKHIKVKVNGSFVGYKDASRTSKPTGTIKAGIITSSKPKINNYEWEATALPGTWGPSGVALSYQWYVGSSKIKGATKATFGIPTSYIGKKIKVRVTGTLAGYTTVVHYSKTELITASS